MSEITVSGIFIYPVKGARGIAVERAITGDRGFEHDRRFMIVEPSGLFVTQRKHARLSLLETAIEGATLVLRAPGQSSIRVPLRPEGPAERRVEVWGDKCRAVEVGAEADAYLSDFLGERVGLVHMPDEVVRRVDGRYAQRKEKVGFADGFPYLLASEGSLSDLNARLSEPAPMDRFRPNIVIRGAAAWVEDEWETFSVGEAVFHALKPCSRCVVITVDQATGEQGKEPLATLSTFRSKMKRVYFGQNLVAEAGGEVRVGDEVRVRGAEYGGK
jgi:MOSC domain-containing protein